MVLDCKERGEGRGDLVGHTGTVVVELELIRVWSL